MVERFVNASWFKGNNRTWTKPMFQGQPLKEGVSSRGADCTESWGEQPVPQPRAPAWSSPQCLCRDSQRTAATPPLHCTASLDGRPVTPVSQECMGTVIIGILSHSSAFSRRAPDWDAILHFSRWHLVDVPLPERRIATVTFLWQFVWYGTPASMWYLCQYRACTFTTLIQRDAAVSSCGLRTCRSGK